MTEEEIIYEEALKERDDARKRASDKYDEDIRFARKQMHEGMHDADRVYKLRISQTRNPHCHVCHLDPLPGYACCCSFKCPSTLCKGES